MDIKEIDNLHLQVRKKYLEHQLRDTQIIEKSITFYNQYFNLVEHPLTPEDVEKLANFDLALKIDFLHWVSCNPKTEDEIKKFYRNTPFEFFKNLFKNMDVMHYENVLGQFIIPALRKNNSKIILDYGGGSGYMDILLTKMGYQVTFSEINKISLEWMKFITKELNFNIEIIDLQEKEIEKDYDAIILKDVIEHLVNPNSVINKLSQKTNNLLIIPEKMTKEEDYLPMHFNYELQKGV